MTEFQTHGSDPLDPETATGPPWPRLVATSPGFHPPRLIKWPIIVGLLLYVAYIAAVFALTLAMPHHAGSSAEWNPGGAQSTVPEFSGT